MGYSYSDEFLEKTQNLINACESGNVNSVKQIINSGYKFVNVYIVYIVRKAYGHYQKNSKLFHEMIDVLMNTSVENKRMVCDFVLYVASGKEGDANLAKYALGQGANPVCARNPLIVWP